MKRILSLLLCITVILSAFAFVMPVYASTEEAFIEYIWYDDFSGETISDRYINNAGTKINTLTDMYTLENGALKFTSPAKSYYYFVDNQTIGDKTKKLVVSYKFKTSNSSAHTGQNHNLAATALVKVIGNSVLNNQNGSTITTITPTSWTTITCVLDSQSTMRDIYVNGQCFGPYDKSSYQTDDFTYFNTNGKFRFSNAQYAPVNTTIELDDYMIYYLPTELKYELESATATEVKLNLNMIPDAETVIPANFTVKTGSTEVTPATATLSAEDPRQVVLTFTEDLAPGTYTVSAANLTAGSSATDVADTLNLTSNPELAFSVSPAKVEWTATNEFYSWDYNTLEPVTGVIAGEYTNGIWELGEGLYNIEADGENKVLTMQQNTTSAVGNYIFFLARKDNFVSKTAYAVETKVKVDFSKNPENAMLDARTGGYGLPFTSLHNGVIYSDLTLSTSVGTYEDGEWVTLKNVYYNTPVSINGVEKLRRDVYVNGQFIKTLYDDNWSDYSKYLDGSTSHFWLRFRIRDRYNTINTEGKVYFDYMRMYKPNDNFAAQLTSGTNVDTSYINVKFNNIPAEADLTDKIYIADENGTKVSDIAVPEFINEFNADGYAAKVNLWFATELENGNTYKLCINGVTDIMDNTLYQEETFTTKAAPEAEGLTITDGIAAVTINEYSEPLTLIVAGYTVVDDVEQMTTVVEKTIEATGTFSTEEAVKGDIVKAFLWKGTKPVISAAQ